MQQIIYFFIKYRNFLLFVLLFSIATYFTIQTHNYHSDKFFSSANVVTGTLYNFKTSITTYSSLAKENKKLVEENVYLRKQIEYYKDVTEPAAIDTTIFPLFDYQAAKIINNNYAYTKNYLTLNKGARDGVVTDMGVISGRGLVGIVSRVSENFSTVQSVLNTNSRTNAKLKKSGHFGTLVWDTQNPNIVQLIDIPRLTQIEQGDTIITGGKSVIFPEGILIGVIESFRPDDFDENYYVIDVSLFTDMTSLENVYLIKNNFAEELYELEMSVSDE